jgi:hypothetical protein
MRSWFVAAAAAAGLVFTGTVAEAGVIVPIPPVPGSTSTVVRGINNNNVITGYFTTSDGQKHGFFGGLDGKYTTFDFGTGNTEPQRINDKGLITGTAPDQGFVIGREFIRKLDGTFLQIERKGVPLDGFAAGIRNDGRLVGDSWLVNEEELLPYTARRGRHVQDLPVSCDGAAHDARARDINEGGTIVGFCQSNEGANYTGFILKDGTVTFVYEEGSFDTNFNGINKNDIISGDACIDDACATEHALIYDLAAGRFKDISVPGAAWSYAEAINDAGVVVVDADKGPFLYCQKKTACPNVGAAIRTHDRDRAARVRINGSHAS